MATSNKSITTTYVTPTTITNSTTSFKVTASPQATFSTESLLPDLLKRCFQNVLDPSCTFSKNIQYEPQPVFIPPTTSEIVTKMKTTTKSLEEKIEEFNLLFQITTPSYQTSTTRRSTLKPDDSESEARRVKVQAELRVAFLGSRNQK